jgi:hypothetical protein
MLPSRSPFAALPQCDIDPDQIALRATKILENPPKNCAGSMFADAA